MIGALVTRDKGVIKQGITVISKLCVLELLVPFTVISIVLVVVSSDWLSVARAFAVKVVPERVSWT